MTDRFGSTEPSITYSPDGPSGSRSELTPHRPGQRAIPSMVVDTRVIGQLATLVAQDEVAGAVQRETAIGAVRPHAAEREDVRDLLVLGLPSGGVRRNRPKPGSHP
ncbi:MAG: hypothetical protein ACRDYA_00340 [Egibacteraceae bacterium]